MADFGWFTSLCSVAIIAALSFVELAPEQIAARFGGVAGLVAYACLALWILGFCLCAVWPRQHSPDLTHSGDEHD